MELAESLWIISSGRIKPVHRGWFDEVSDRLHKVDRELLEVLVPGSKMDLARFLVLAGGAEATTIEAQLAELATLPVDRFRRELIDLWGDDLPPRGQQLLAEGPAGLRRAADALWQYWTVALDPYWTAVRAVIDGDIAHRATTLARHGVATMFAGLHRYVSLRDETLHVDVKAPASERKLTGGGLTLVPSVFLWPHFYFDDKAAVPGSLAYPARGVGGLWAATPGGQKHVTDADALAALLGRNRAMILLALESPQATTRLARRLGISAPSVNQHLTALRRAGLVTSWRSGRFVLYQRTALGTSLVEASDSGRN